VPDLNRRVEITDVSVVFRTGGALSSGHTTALDRVSLALPAGETLGLVGESGSGKSTLAKVLSGLVKPTSGTVTVSDGAAQRIKPGFRQLVGQNPRWALNPQLRVWRSVAEPLAILGTPRAVRRSMVDEMLGQVGLPVEFGDRYPHQLSGGQLQRAAIARALISEPGLVVFDEAVSALDMSVQVQIINLIRRLQSELRFNGLFISHDLAAVRYAASTIAVLYRGMLMHVAPVSSFYGRLYHPYSLALQAAGADDGSGISLREEPLTTAGSPGPAANGCPLSSRCPFVIPRCGSERPALTELQGQQTACHRAAELAQAADPAQLLSQPSPALIPEEH
jgi:ABC-type glutathione transport system ATPase component